MKHFYFHWLLFFAILSIFCNLNITIIAIHTSNPLWYFIYLPCILITGFWVSLFLWFRNVFEERLKTKAASVRLFYVFFFIFLQLIMAFVVFNIYATCYAKTKDTQAINPEEIFYLSHENAFFVNEEITPGFAWTVSKLIAEHPNVNTIYLRSGGGNLNEAIVAEELLYDAGVTHVIVLDMCYSACTALFFPAVLKEINETGEIALHGCDLAKKQNFFLNFATNAFKKNLWDSYRTSGVPESIIKKAFSLSCDDDISLSATNLLDLGISGIYHGKKPQYLIDRYGFFGQSKMISVSIKNHIY